ncbi:hypothetical protein CEXT_229431 [Caerostris extrusa]|uniref:Uncharacterized protein n=1 Tax=Caerostris extrusa TaxID=172846 RepID=A0AAV4XEW3_CAEEX|nr:hypothetical protein CEXT_229431 [Caerostris extrusa]
MFFNSLPLLRHKQNCRYSPSLGLFGVTTLKALPISPNVSGPSLTPIAGPSVMPPAGQGRCSGRYPSLEPEHRNTRPDRDVSEK